MNNITNNDEKPKYIEDLSRESGNIKKIRVKQVNTC